MDIMNLPSKGFGCISDIDEVGNFALLRPGGGFCFGFSHGASHFILGPFIERTVGGFLFSPYRKF